MASIHDISTAGGNHQKRAAVECMERISSAAGSVQTMVARILAGTNTRQEIYTLGVLIEQVANQASLLCDGPDRLTTQHIRRLADMLREHSGATDTLRIEALAAAIRLLANDLARRLDPG